MIIMIYLASNAAFHVRADCMTNAEVFMKLFSRQSQLLLLSALWFSGPLDAQLVDVSIKVDRTRFETGEVIPVTVTLSAKGDSSAVLYDGGVTPVPIQGQPISVLEFDIRNDAGKRVERQPERDSIILMKPSFCNFRELSPRSFEGKAYYINVYPFSYRIDVPGRYRIKARWKFRALEWLKDFSKEVTVDGAKKNFTDAFLAVGTIESNEIEIEIAETKPPTG